MRAPPKKVAANSAANHVARGLRALRPLRNQHGSVLFTIGVWPIAKVRNRRVAAQDALEGVDAMGPPWLTWRAQMLDLIGSETAAPDTPQGAFGQS